MQNRSRAMLGLLVVMLAVPQTVWTEREVHIVMISIDGLMPSTYTQPGPAKVPTLRRLVAAGTYAEGVVGVLPSVTYPSHTTLITGVPPAVHGIIDNRMVDPEGRANAMFFYASDIKVATLLGAARAGGLRTAAVAWPTTVGMDVDFHVPEFWRVAYGPDHPETLTLLRAMSTPHLVTAAEIARGKPFGWRQTDEERLDIGTFILRTYRPHLMLLHLTDVDGAQHRAGVGSASALEAIERLDGYVGAVLETIETAGIEDRTYVAIVSDHGFLPTEHQLQPNAIFKKEGLLKTDDAGAIVEWQAYFHSSGGSGFVMLKDQSDVTLRERVRAVLERLRADPANGIAELWTAEDLVRLGAYPLASFGIDMQPGFYTGREHDVLLAASRSKGGHGFSPLRPELHASLILAGPGLRGRGNLGVVRMTQIAPTLAQLFRVGLSPAADKPLDIAWPATSFPR